jgi:hypothetical protein
VKESNVSVEHKQRKPPIKQNVWNHYCYYKSTIFSLFVIFLLYNNFYIDYLH